MDVVPTIIVLLLVLGAAVSIKTVKQYERGPCSGWVGFWTRGNPGCG
jgi:hypothetical protein